MAVANTLIGEWNQSGAVVKTFYTPAHAAATATEVIELWEVPHAFRVTAIEWSSGTAITGQDTNTTHLNFRDGTTEKGTIDFVSGTDSTALTPNAVTITAWTLDDGDTLNLQIEKVGTGLLIPAGIATITGEWR